MVEFDTRVKGFDPFHPRYSDNQVHVPVNSEIFARILFSQIVLKDILATLKLRDFDMIYLHKQTTDWFRHFSKVLFSRNFA